MSDKTELAISLHDKGYNCAQATVCAFAEELGIDEKELFSIMEGFGFGMGCMGTCGAVSGMAALAGLCESDRNTDRPATKKKSYSAAKEMIGKFREKNGSVICRELKGVDTKKVLRSCPGCIEDGVALIEEYLANRKQVEGE